MRELNNREIEGVSGGSLTSVILDFFNQLGGSSKEKTEWVRPDSVPAANPVSGSSFGMGIVGIAAAVVFGLLAF
ncbi:hypothetical protein [Pantoea agglomerans]|uniref:hypothetical protein n=1 Tax=Enterobacter agglomerans TaxID=549 RepID=UPI0010BF842C|nr:hypothetical protein [Pantoea agglomerans]MBD8144726.1 hypothetical protein [Pantoea agglomerans]MBD8183341.1 hypothetical protein [Pantoea agglomerans]MBD8222427.1 hypothetical protein [Pantoea agglomerans]TKJ56453.1 hypothetical protein PagCFBP13505_12190 [Pantoea agglomerans]TKK19422.1 hypothetical protein PagCFBP13516_11255 [Pantoea agglomerans]